MRCKQCPVILPKILVSTSSVPVIVGCDPGICRHTWLWVSWSLPGDPGSMQPLHKPPHCYSKLRFAISAHFWFATGATTENPILQVCQHIPGSLQLPCILPLPAHTHTHKLFSDPGRVWKPQYPFKNKYQIWKSPMFYKFLLGNPPFPLEVL